MRHPSCGTYPAFFFFHSWPDDPIFNLRDFGRAHPDFFGYIAWGQTRADAPATELIAP